MYSASDFIEETRPSLATTLTSSRLSNIHKETKRQGSTISLLSNENIVRKWIDRILNVLRQSPNNNPSLEEAAASTITLPSQLGETVSGKLSYTRTTLGHPSSNTIPSSPSSVTFSPVRPSTDLRKEFVSDFLTKEMEYHAEIEQGFAKISSHLDILNHLAGGDYLKTHDESLVQDIMKISLYFIQSIRVSPRLYWTDEFKNVEMKFQTFALKMERYMEKFEKEFPGSAPALERTEWILQGVKNRFEIYHRLCLVPFSSTYWDLEEDIRDIIDVFYRQEMEFASFLKLQPSVLNKFLTLGILDSVTGKMGFKVTKLLTEASAELSEEMLYNPCSYGLNHRRIDLAQVYDIHCDYTSQVLERLYDYRDSTSRTWHRAPEELSDEQLDALIIAFKKDLAKPVERLIHFQHLLSYIEKSNCLIDPVQVTLAKYTVDGILEDFFKIHGKEIFTTLTPIYSTKKL